MGDMYIPASTSKSVAEGFINTPDVFTSYKENLEEFVQTCKKHNIKAILISEGCFLSGNSYMLLGEDMAIVYDKMYGIMEEVAKKNNVAFIDAAKLMDGIPDKKTLFTDGLHLTARGNETLSDIIYNGIMPVIQEGQAS